MKLDMPHVIQRYALQWLLLLFVLSIMAWQVSNTSIAAKSTTLSSYSMANADLLEQPFMLSPRVPVVLDFPANVAKVDYVLLRLTLSHSKVFYQLGDSAMMPGKYSLLGDQQSCTVKKNNKMVCRLLVKQDHRHKTLRLMTPRPDVIVDEISAEIIKSTSSGVFGHANLLILMLIVCMTLPFIWLLHRSVIASQWLIISLAVILLGAISVLYAIFLLAFVLLMFTIGKSFSQKEKQYPRLFLACMLSLITVLFLGKYGQQFFSQLFPSYGHTNIGVFLGLSYFIIRMIDVQMRWYRKTLTDLSVREYLCYLLFPPTIPAGPIEMIDKFHANRLTNMTTDDIAYGLARIALGVFKKIVIADAFLLPLLYGESSFGPYGLFQVITANPEPGSATLLFLFASFIFAYIDFSAYSDMAIGLSRLFGYRIMENFTWPLFATNLMVFWRSWHRSLSLWCFRNIYFPLTIKYRNPYLPAYVTLITVGLWHSLGLSWLTWGVYHATGISLLAFFNRRIKPMNNQILSLIAWPLKSVLTLTFVTAGYSFVVFESYPLATEIFINFWKSLAFR